MSEPRPSSARTSEDPVDVGFAATASDSTNTDDKNQGQAESEAREGAENLSLPRHRGTPGRAAAPTFHVAGFWRRLGAACIDAAIILPVSLLMSYLAGYFTGVHLPASRNRGLDFWLDLFLANDPALLGAIGLTIAIATMYLLIFQITTARTPGMRATKTRIIDIYGDSPTTGRAALRTVGYLLGLATLTLGFLWIGFDSEKRGLHDWLSGTYVVKA